MKWHKVSEVPFPIQETFIAGFEVVKNGNSFFEPCVVYCRDYDSEIIDVFNDCPCGWDDKDITYWTEYSEPQEIAEAETQPITQAKAMELDVAAKYKTFTEFAERYQLCWGDCDEYEKCWDAATEAAEEKFTAANTGSPKCLCITCSRLKSNGGTCEPNTNSFVTACEGYAESLRAGA